MKSHIHIAIWIAALQSVLQIFNLKLPMGHGLSSPFYNYSKMAELPWIYTVNQKIDVSVNEMWCLKDQLC